VGCNIISSWLVILNQYIELMQIIIRALLLIVPFSIFGQISNASDDMDFSNVAYHSDAKFHSKTYKASALNFNTSYMGFNTSIVTELNAKLRFQQSLGSWKIGVQTSFLNLAQVQRNAQLGLSIGKDIAINRHWSARPAIGVSALNSQLYFSNGSFYDWKMSSNYNLNAGLQIRYKKWQLFGGLNSIYSTTDSLQISDSLYFVMKRSPHGNIGLKKSFTLDSIRQMEASLFYENYQGFNYVNASVVYQNQSELFLLGLCTNQVSIGCGLVLPKKQQVMLTFNMQRYSLLQKTYRPGFQLNYKWQLIQQEPLRLTITPAF